MAPRMAADDLADHHSSPSDRRGGRSGIVSDRAHGCHPPASTARPVGRLDRMSILTKVLRAGEGKKQKALSTLVPDINALEPEIQALSDEALSHKTVEFRERLDGLTGDALDDALNDLLLEAFAVTREAAWREIGQRHFDVQLMGGAALHFGWIAEMKTGEGKTLVSTLPAYLNGLSGRGMHIVTVNDYLAKRDAEWMGQIHRRLGLNVGLVLSEIENPEIKRQNYACDI